MSDLASAAHLAKIPAQVPVSWYFDPGVYRAEVAALFDSGPGYIGHELMVPKAGDYYALDWTGNSKVLVRNGETVELLSNVCRHRQSLVVTGRGNARSLVCPVHRWTYGLDGKLLGAPQFPNNPCLDLGRTPLQRWNGLLFAGKRSVAGDLAGLTALDRLDFSGYALARVDVDEYACNWKTFMEVYLEVYHVGPYHPGLGHYVNADDLRWEFGDWYNAQFLGINKDLRDPGTPVYKRWHETLLRYTGGKVPRFGALWMTYFPNVMLEWYPHVLVISTLIPRGPEACTNVVEFYYPEDIALFEPEFVETEQAAFIETALEDREICDRIHAGRRALWLEGREDAGPFQSPMEDGVAHFHEFLSREIAPHL
ncbi:MAG: aromatic ring-hydroxylating dioxygenase subunit alpha [Betaproteobacteria bacterium]|nr:aromatic ring-hydroxylating dioxygenase subunit alpha [Betaproteobacteria bacterium]